MSPNEMDVQVEAEATQTPTDEESTQEVLFFLGLLDGHWWRAQDVASKCAALAGIADLSTLASYLCEEVTSPHRLERRRSLLSGESLGVPLTSSIRSRSIERFQLYKCGV